MTVQWFVMDRPEGRPVQKLVLLLPEGFGVDTLRGEDVCTRHSEVSFKDVRTSLFSSTYQIGMSLWIERK